MKRVLITGINGMDGSHLADFLLNKNYEVFTMATPAWASTHERIMIENRLSDLEPDLVVSLSGNNDVHWGAKNRNVLWFRAYHDEFYFDLLDDISTPWIILPRAFRFLKKSQCHYLPVYLKTIDRENRELCLKLFDI